MTSFDIAVCGICVLFTTRVHQGTLLSGRHPSTLTGFLGRGPSSLGWRITGQITSGLYHLFYALLPPLFSLFCSETLAVLHLGFSFSFRHFECAEFLKFYSNFTHMDVSHLPVCSCRRDQTSQSESRMLLLMLQSAPVHLSIGQSLWCPTFSNVLLCCAGSGSQWTTCLSTCLSRLDRAVRLVRGNKQEPLTQTKALKGQRSTRFLCCSRAKTN